MATLNKVILIGNLGADPEIRETAAGNTVAQFSLATNEYRPNGEGTYEEHTEWHRIVLFGQAADTYGRMLSKGDRVFIDGRIQTRTWQDAEGNEHKIREIIAWQVRRLSNGMPVAKAAANG
ncbi:MAG: single-stranded DNA-binding protein [Deltaproteobacteria bacterium]|nr:MAG: single-stranded DNA-binding protein [Deltaproteobacteria bacterium]